MSSCPSCFLAEENPVAGSRTSNAAYKPRNARLGVSWCYPLVGKRLIFFLAEENPVAGSRTSNAAYKPRNARLGVSWSYPLVSRRREIICYFKNWGQEGSKDLSNQYHIQGHRHKWDRQDHGLASILLNRTRLWRSCQPTIFGSGNTKGGFFLESAMCVFKSPNLKKKCHY